MGLPLLAGEYLCLIYHTTPQTIALVFFSETIFALNWFGTAYWPAKSDPEEKTAEHTRFFVFEICMDLAILGIGLYCLLGSPALLPATYTTIVFSQSGIFLFTNTILLLSAIFSAWRLEGFWRSLNPTQRWEYKFLVVGSYLVCCTLGWAVSYRFIYHRMNFEHFHLLSAIFLFAWGLMIYAVVRRRLLNRKLFVSRKVVYVSVAPLVFGLYLIFIGIIALIMHYFNQPFPVVLRWLLSVVGMVVIALLVVSGKVRHDVKYFVSMNFYTNKYEYRDEWLAFSRLLHNALTETEVVSVLHQVLAKSLYTNIIFIWTGDEERGYRLAFYKGISIAKEKDYHLPKDHPLVLRLETNDCYYVRRTKYNIRQLPVPGFFPEPGLVFFVPLTIGEQMVGIVGLGPEFTGGLYGRDDSDLLTALGSQAASALMSARMAKKLAKAKQQEAWDVMSAFVLHDVKNAASILSMTRQNAPAHIHDPEFQQDMLDAIDDSLKRMDKVQNRLSEVRGYIVPVWQDIELPGWLQDCCRKLQKRLHGLEVNFSCEETILMKTDTELLARLMENLLLNALESGGKGTVVEVKVSCDGNLQVHIDLADSGPGLHAEMLPDALFEPFKTDKPGGSGVGLWQAKRLTAILGGNIVAENSDSGARFVVNLPVRK